MQKVVGSSPPTGPRKRHEPPRHRTCSGHSAPRRVLEPQPPRTPGAVWTTARSGLVLTVVLELCVARRGERISQHLEVVLQLRQVERRVGRELRAAGVLRRMCLTDSLRLRSWRRSLTRGVRAAVAPGADVEAGTGAADAGDELDAAVLAGT